MSEYELNRVSQTFQLANENISKIQYRLFKLFDISKTSNSVVTIQKKFSLSRCLTKSNNIKFSEEK